MPSPPYEFVDIHCHLLPEIDDGASSLAESLAMARMAVDDGITHTVVTPHQLGNFQQNTGPLVRERVQNLQAALDAEGIPLKIHGGGDVRIEEGMLDGIRAGEVMTLADRGKHILLELPHELYYPIEGLVADLRQAGIQAILSHPERNQGLLSKPDIVGQLVEAGCLMQVTAGSLVGTFGPRCQEMSEKLLLSGWVHFLATDAHGMKSRRPMLARAFERASELVGREIATNLCYHHPKCVVEGTFVDLNTRTRRQRERPQPARAKAKRSWLQRLVSA
ncbi:MAG: CpsB/CapC family capsule biosynthesis tyrosine phosphatase [Planctomycetota bacterium]